MKTLHIVDGESTGGTLRASGFAKRKEILVWREALYTGPVPAGLSLRQLSRLRSRFWTRGKSGKEFESRDAALAKHRQYETIALWFGPKCVLCQLSLMQVLSWFLDQKVPATRLTWVALHGGELSPDEIAGGYSLRRPVTIRQMRLAERAWRAFRLPSPRELTRLLEGDLRAQPGLRESILRLLQEYPNRRNGLSRLENLLLRDIRKCETAKVAVAMGTVMTKETVGDTLLADMLRNFVTAEHPLVRFAEPFAGRVKSWRFNGSKLSLTDAGQRAVAGRADHISLNGIDRWIGGVHLQGRTIPWRWDSRLKAIVTQPSRV